MMLRRTATLLALGTATLLSGACSSTTNSGTTGDGGVESGADGSATTSLPFTPSNIDLSSMDLSKVGDIDLSGTNCIIDSETADGMVPILCDMKFDNSVAHKIFTLPDQTKLSVWVMKSLRIEASTVLSISLGHLPVVLVALDKMDLLGSIDVAPGTTGGSFNGTSAFVKGVGPGGGTAGDNTAFAGGGASYCGLGGVAGAKAGSAPASPAGYGTPESVPLVGGSAGGSGELANSDANGGGALQIVAANGIVLHSGAYIRAGGGGGIFAGGIGAGGGGSGGAILIEAQTVQIDGVIAANGGGGGQGANGDSGEAGHFDATPALGGHKGTDSYGGNGSAAATIAGAPGVFTAASSSPGGGGGGAGRIRINTQSGAAAVTGTFSPALTTTCVTQGKLK